MVIYYLQQLHLAQTTDNSNRKLWYMDCELLIVYCTYKYICIVIAGLDLVCFSFHSSNLTLIEPIMAAADDIFCWKYVRNISQASIFL